MKTKTVLIISGIAIVVLIAVYFFFMRKKKCECTGESDCGCGATDETDIEEGRKGLVVVYNPTPTIGESQPMTTYTTTELTRSRNS